MKLETVWGFVVSDAKFMITRGYSSEDKRSIVWASERIADLEAQLDGIQLADNDALKMAEELAKRNKELEAQLADETRQCVAVSEDRIGLMDRVAELEGNVQKLAMERAEALMRVDMREKEIKDLNAQLAEVKEAGRVAAAEAENLGISGNSFTYLGLICESNADSN